MAIQPPSSAPSTPTAVVPMQPPGSVRPGINARAIVPANRPRRIQPKKPIPPSYPVDLEERAVGAEVRDLALTDPRALAPALVDVAANRQRRPDALDRRGEGRAPEVIAGARLVAMAVRRGVEDEHGALGAFLERRRRLVVGEVEAPVPGRDRDPGAQAEERPARDLRALAVEDRRRGPRVAASRSASAVSLLPGTSTVGASIAASAPIVSSSPSWIEAKSPAPITTSASRSLHEAAGAAEVAVEVAESESFIGGIL